MDLRLDIERRKKYSSHERDPGSQDRGRDTGDSPDSSRERSEKFSKRHKKSKYVHPSFTTNTLNSVGYTQYYNKHNWAWEILQVPFMLLGKVKEKKVKVKRSALAQVLPHHPHPPSPNTKEICLRTRLIPKMKALIGHDWVRGSYQGSKEGGHLEDL